MIIEKLLSEENLTESEKQIAHFILDKTNKIDNLTSTQLGKASYSSQSSVMRLCRKLGFESYRAFISVLTIERNEYFKVNELPEDLPSQFFSSYEDIQATISRLYAETMIKTNLLLDKNKMIRICNRIMSAETIDIYGIGLSNTIAKQFVFKLQSLGLHCTYHTGLNQLYIDKINTKTNISILISLSGKNEAILNISNILNEHSIYTAAITNHKVKKFIDAHPDTLVFYTNEYTDIDSMCAIFAAQYIIDQIYALIMSRIQISMQFKE